MKNTSLMNPALGLLALMAGTLVLAPAASSARGRKTDRVDQLVRLLETSRSYKIRAQVASHLARLKKGGERVNRALRRALSDEHETVRKVATAALKSRGVKPDALPPSKRAARATREREKARERLQRAINAKARLYIAMGALANSSGTGGAELGQIFAAALRKEFAAVPAITTRWEGGVAPTAAQLKARQMTGFVLDGAVKTLERRRRGRHFRYYCLVKISLATYPGNSMKAFYTGEASTKLPTGEVTPDKQIKIQRQIVRLAAHKAKKHFVQDYFAYKGN